MFNATVAGTTRKFLKSHCVKKQGSRGGSRFDINEVEWGTKRNIKVGTEKNTCNFMLMFQFISQIVLNPGVLLFQNDQVDEKNCLRLHHTTIILVIFIVTIIASIVLILYVALGGWNDHIG